MNNKEKTIYLAGFVDGEGHFRVQSCKNGQGRPFIQPMIAITNTNREIIDWLLDNYGGFAYLTKKKLPIHSPLWRWSITGRKAIEIAMQLEPYLMVKREQVKRLTRIKYDDRGWMDKTTAFN